jgi:hypothetical protein
MFRSAYPYLKPDNEPGKSANRIAWTETLELVQQSSNPNCFLNMVPGSSGIARGYTFGHDGYHARGPGRAIALPAMVGGEVKKVTTGDNSKASFNSIVDIALMGRAVRSSAQRSGKCQGCKKPDNKKRRTADWERHWWHG